MNTHQFSCSFILGSYILNSQIIFGRSSSLRSKSVHRFVCMCVCNYSQTYNKIFMKRNFVKPLVQSLWRHFSSHFMVFSILSVLINLFPRSKWVQYNSKLGIKQFYLKVSFLESNCLKWTINKKNHCHSLSLNSLNPVEK